MFIPDPNFFPSLIPDPDSKDSGSRIQIQKIPDPGSGSASKNLCILTSKMVSKLSEI
jgi:hypothetical protein